MARRAKQVEGVYENVPKSGIWYARLRVNGKLVRKSIGTRAEAIAYIEKARTIKRTGDGVLPTTAKQPARTFSELAKTGSEVTVGDLCDDLLRHIRRNPQDYKDQRNPPYRIGLVRTKFGNRSATTVQPFEIADWLDDMVDLAPATRNRLKVTVSAIYKRGKERGRVNVNPARDVKQKRVNNCVVRDLKRDEEDRIRAVLQKAVDSCPPENKRRRERLLHRIYELDVSLGSGMRKGEQYSIVWPDVNFDDRKITARDTKNGETRIIPMIDDVFHALKAIKAMGLKRKNRSRDCPNPSSKDSVFAVGDNKRWWKATLKAAKVTNYRWHDNRHTFCPMLPFRVKEYLEQYAIQEALPSRFFEPFGLLQELPDERIRNVRASTCRLVDIPPDDKEYVQSATGGFLVVEFLERGVLIVIREDFQTANHSMPRFVLPDDEQAI